MNIARRAAKTALIGMFAGAVYVSAWLPISMYRWNKGLEIQDLTQLESILRQEKKNLGIDTECILLNPFGSFDENYAGSHKVGANPFTDLELLEQSKGDCYVLTLAGKGKSREAIRHELSHIALGHLENRQDPTLLQKILTDAQVEYYLLIK